MTRHHPPEELLLDYAAGSLPEPLALAVACHLSFCDECWESVARLDVVGGSLLDRVDAEPVELATLDEVLARLDEPEPPRMAGPVLDAVSRAVLPSPLRNYVASSLDGLPWRRIGRIGSEVRLPTTAQGYKTSLMRLRPGSVMPRHTHRGSEYTVVLTGGYRDGDRQFLRGDMDVNDPTNEHRPVVDPDGECLCLVVLDAPLRLTGPVGRLVNPFLRV